ncbi:MAG: hypothetical protein ABI779_00090 [Acidobacteriota bacterium]
MKAIAVLIAALFLALPLSADFCDMNLRYENGQLRWNAITGATNYSVLANYGSLKAPEYATTLNTFMPVTRRASGPVMVHYIVTAEIQPGVRILPGDPVALAEAVDACTGTIDVTLAADPAFRKLTRKAVFPVVGSTPGAFGGQFKTALEIRGGPSQHGRLVFHPAGRAAADDDPSMAYSFLNTRVMTFDDVVAAMGQQGLGSLDIVPDADSADRLPEGVVRLYNDTSIGTFGTFNGAVLPSDYLNPAGLLVHIPDERFRVNIGLRALEATSVQVIILNAAGRPEGLRNLTFPAGWMEMKSASDFAGRALTPGQSLSISVFGAAVPFYTITENATNDPTLVLGPPRETQTDAGKFVD